MCVVLCSRYAVMCLFFVINNVVIPFRGVDLSICHVWNVFGTCHKRRKLKTNWISFHRERCKQCSTYASDGINFCADCCHYQQITLYKPRTDCSLVTIFGANGTRKSPTSCTITSQQHYVLHPRSKTGCEPRKMQYSSQNNNCIDFRSGYT